MKCPNCKNTNLSYDTYTDCDGCKGVYTETYTCRCGTIHRDTYYFLVTEEIPEQVISDVDDGQPTIEQRGES